MRQGENGYKGLNVNVAALENCAEERFFFGLATFGSRFFFSFLPC
jgi:hypothetical protein